MAEQATEKINYFTREGAATITAETLPEVRKQLRTKTERARKAGENLIEAAAHATRGARIAVESTGGTFKIGEWADQVNGGRRTAVYIWDRMGTAMWDLGVEPGSPEWTALVGKGATATKAPVSYVLEGKGLDGKGDKGSVTPTREDLDKALDVHFERDDEGNLLPSRGRKAAEIKERMDRIKGVKAAAETTDEGSSQDDSVAAGIAAALDMILAGLKTEHVSQEEYAEMIHDRLHAVNKAAADYGKAVIKARKEAALAENLGETA